jgi:predicted nucleic acid-binding protein
MSGGKAFFDTNVLLYMYGGDEKKQPRSTELFREHAMSSRLLLSTQVVQEFYVAGSRKLAIPGPELREAVTALLDLPLVIIAGAHIHAAIENEARFGISFWNGLIVAAAEAGNAEILFTEDLNDGQEYGHVVVCNPFRG